MKKVWKLYLCGAAAVLAAAGCSKKAEAPVASPSSAQESSSAVASQGETAVEYIDLSSIDSGKITLGQYKGVEVTVLPVEVTDEEVDQEIQYALSQNPDYEDITDRGVQDGDVVNIDFVGMKDGEAFEGGTSKGFDFVVGTTSFIDGFKEGLMGAKAGDQLSLNLTFPEEYPQSPDLAGQDVVFEVTVNSIKVEKPAQLDDAFVQKISDYKTVDEYKQSIRDQLTEYKKQQTEQQKQYDVLDAVLANAKIEANQEAIDANYNNFVYNYTNQAAGFGMGLADYISAAYGLDEESFQSTLREMATSAVNNRLLFNAVAEAEGITVSDEDKVQMAAEFGFEDAATLNEQMGEFSVQDYLISMKVMEFLSENAIMKTN